MNWGLCCCRWSIHPDFVRWVDRVAHGKMLECAVKPEIFGHHILFQRNSPFFLSKSGFPSSPMTTFLPSMSCPALDQSTTSWLTVLERIPEYDRFGKHFVCMIVQLGVHTATHVRCCSVTRFAHDLIAQVVLEETFALRGCGFIVNATGNVVVVRCVATHAIEILAFGSFGAHMDIKRFGRFYQ